jgi:hypothetical protein
MDINLTIPYLREFVSLWWELREAVLREEIDDSITWNLKANGDYITT